MKGYVLIIAAVTLLASVLVLSTLKESSDSLLQKGDSRYQLDLCLLYVLVLTSPCLQRRAQLLQRLRGSHGRTAFFVLWAGKE